MRKLVIGNYFKCRGNRKRGIWRMGEGRETNDYNLR